MSRFFLSFYDYLERHRVQCYLLMAVSFAVMLFFAVQVTPEEDVTRFFPDTKEARHTEAVFRNLKIKDRIILMLSARDTTAKTVTAEQLIEAGAALKEGLLRAAGEEYINEVFAEADGDIAGQATRFIYDYLPLFLTEADYARMDSLFLPGQIDRRMQANLRTLLLPVSTGIKPIILRDPAGLGTPLLESLRQFQPAAHYTVYDRHIFSADMSTLLLFLTPRYPTGETGKNSVLVDAIEEELKATMERYPGIEAAYFGSPPVSVYNARQIKQDTVVTLGIAMLIIVVLVLLVFKSRSAVVLIILPVVYGAVFSLAMIYLVKGSVSGIAIGAGSAIFGVALSYSIHVLSHFNHVASIRQLIRELAYPLTVGSFTTVGAFFGLLFTGSELLRDFGLFSGLALIGTTVFCLVFLPHLLQVKHIHRESGYVLRLIERINGYAFEKNKPLVAGIALLFAVCLFLSDGVTFDGNMMNLSFEPPALKAAEERLNRLFESDNRTVLFVSVGKTADEGLKNYAETNRALSRLKEEGKVRELISAETLLIPPHEQAARVRRWNSYWTDARKQEVKASVDAAARKSGFREGTFDAFHAFLDTPYRSAYLTDNDPPVRLLDEWVTRADSLFLFITQVRIAQENKEEVYAGLSGNDGLVIFDRGYFANKWVSAIHDDFYLILYISSFLIFFALLISYGRIELTLMTFAPMAISWVIILGIMAVGGIAFNIVNIILATFIFGLGDDFSIFIMDGLQQEYRTGNRLLASHKTAIFFSSLTAVIGLGALSFSRHPALQSISVISVLGIVSVVLVSYTVLPVLFRCLISRPAMRGNYPYTFSGLLTSAWLYNAFLTGCSFVIGVASLLVPLPVNRRTKKRLFGLSIMYTLRLFLKTAWVARHVVDNPERETFEKPSVIVANHQSFIDILVLLSLSPKLVMMTNSKVWNFPFVGRIVRYADFVQTAEGYETVLSRLREKVEAGYSVIIFPEGTRSTDGRIRRFHKGAFYVAEKLRLDILPVVLYGTGMIISKRQPFRIKRGILCTRILPRIPYAGDADATYQERTKAVAALLKKEYDATQALYDHTDNPYFYQKLITNYIYKGPVEEWYLRIKVKMEHRYAFFHRHVPRKGTITDIGCGYGALSYMLMMLSEGRTVLGIDYDAEKIAVAAHNFSRNERIRFVAGDALTAGLPDSHAFILNDVLHYMDAASQEQLILRCIGQLLPGGVIIIRDGDPEDKRHHRLTRLTEYLSTRLTGFNKKEREFCFPSGERLMHIAAQYRMAITRQTNDRYTSNVLYVLTKKELPG
ncbi:MAG: 1-acyl-sn-glycerol-3-phosphate acyltransferase [Tannerellaceae bacterium]|jgi:1-acyl-sn-glycerol-3-phosphate acyltransferase|nr:1-acyl-sn-glycerol-3-phosphate acyltransferase [Tannerellaceae bacterium]